MSTVYETERHLFEHLADQQDPEALFITCSDSRFSPALITQTKPGELFVMRNAGNLVPAFQPGSAGGEAATVEYALSALSAEHIIVCGHSNCGAMEGILEPDRLATCPSCAAGSSRASPRAASSVRPSPS